MVSGSELIRRWDGDGRQLATQARAWLAGRGARPNGLGEVDGRIDLRGLRVSGGPLTLGDKGDPAAGVVWESLDLSYAHLDALRLFGARISDSIFDAASLVDLRVWGTTVTGCSFRRADLQHAALGAGEWHRIRTVWGNTTFARAKLNRAVMVGAVVQQCDFERPGRLLLLQDCDIADCTFSGVLDSLLIDGRGHRFPVSPSSLTADFSRSVFRNTRVAGYHLDRTVLPEQPDLLVVHDYPHTLPGAAEWLDGKSASAGAQRAAAFLRKLAMAPGSVDDTDMCFDLDCLSEVALRDLVREALGQAAQR